MLTTSEYPSNTSLSSVADEVFNKKDFEKKEVEKDAKSSAD